MKHVRLGVIGIGIMGRTHARNVMEGKVPGMRLAAVADANPQAFADFGEVAQFATSTELIRSGLVDAVLVSTPHYSHTTVGIEALKAGLHVLVEKPISVHRADAERLIAAHRRRGQVFAAMFNQRTDPCYRKLRSMIQGGELGTVRRIQWTVTNWFRPHVYYRGGGWRATWAGEGGGVLLNQCPHNLDLISWLFGQPTRVQGFCSFGRYHAIEVEDDVTAYLEMKDGAHMTFITSTGEAPGTNRLEVAAENGRVVVENGVLEFTRNKVPTSVFSRTTKGPFTKPDTTLVRHTFKDAGLQHIGIMRNFAAAILRGEPLVSPAKEGIRSVELANAILLSSWTGKPVDLPLAGKVYAAALRRRAAASRRS
jgi:predicted dehydrogenase